MANPRPPPRRKRKRPMRPERLLRLMRLQRRLPGRRRRRTPATGQVRPRWPDVSTPWSLLGSGSPREMVWLSYVCARARKDGPSMTDRHRGNNMNRGRITAPRQTSGSRRDRMERPRGNPSEYEPPTLDRAAGKPGPRFARPARMARWRRTQRDPGQQKRAGRKAHPSQAERRPPAARDVVSGRARRPLAESADPVVLILDGTVLDAGKGLARLFMTGPISSWPSGRDHESHLVDLAHGADNGGGTARPHSTKAPELTSDHSTGRSSTVMPRS